MNIENVTYKGLKFNLYATYNTLEFIVDNEIFRNMESYILNISLMMEYATTKKPEFVIINRINSDYEIPKDLFKFTSDNIFTPLINSGISKIIMVVKEELYIKHYFNNNNNSKDIIAFRTCDEVKFWLENKEN